MRFYINNPKGKGRHAMMGIEKAREILTRSNIDEPYYAKIKASAIQTVKEHALVGVIWCREKHGRDIAHAESRLDNLVEAGKVVRP